MNILEIIAKKRDKKDLTKEEISYFIKQYTYGNITDYQAAALIMAMYINGMNEYEITNLTMEMAYSGEVLDLSKFGIVVDKHSTGGVGDKVTLVLMPIIASLDIPVAKMSGRGLGFTGGTVDKLESIPGYNTNIDINTFVQNVENIGISLIGQTLNLAPADKKLYALRDTISCVESIPLIASSIMSKKIAAGAGKIVLEVTCGSGAFMQTKEKAIELANTMNKIGKISNKETVCIITNMDEPLGYSVGNILEIKETVEILKGKINEDIKEVVLELGAYIIKLAGKGNNLEENKSKILENINNGKAYNKFLELVKNQGGDISYIENLDKFKGAKNIYEVKAKKEGYISKLDALTVGNASVRLGAGRIKKEDDIDATVGFIFDKKVGDFVKKDEILAYVHANDEDKGLEAVNEIEKAYEIVDEKTKKLPTILGIIN